MERILGTNARVANVSITQNQTCRTRVRASFGLWGHRADSDLAVNALHGAVVGSVTRSWRRGRPVEKAEARGLIEPEHLPADGLVVLAPALDLPDPHDRVPVRGLSAGMNLNYPRVAAVADQKALPRRERLASSRMPH